MTWVWWVSQSLRWGPFSSYSFGLLLFSLLKSEKEGREATYEKHPNWKQHDAGRWYQLPEDLGFGLAQFSLPLVLSAGGLGVMRKTFWHRWFPFTLAIWTWRGITSDNNNCLNSVGSHPNNCRLSRIGWLLARSCSVRGKILGLRWGIGAVLNPENE